jgi:hypothetical protein
MRVGRIFCDLANACHCVNHETLLTKLHYYGIQEQERTGSDPIWQTENKKTEFKYFENFSSKWEQ